MNVAFFLMILMIFIHYKVWDSGVRNFISFLVFLAALIYGFSILPSTHVILEFGCELGDPVPPASCHFLMITLAQILSIIGVRS